MKQATNPTMPPQTTSINEDAITTAERLLVLQKSSKNSVIKAEMKRSFLHKMLQFKHDVIFNSQLFDATMGSSLAEKLNLVIPTSKRIINRATNKEMSEIMAEMFEPVKLLHTYLLGQYEEESQSKAFLRSTTNCQRQKDPVFDVLGESTMILEKVDVEVIAARTEKLDTSTKKAIFLTALQRQRKWNNDRVPVPVQLQLCVMCGHRSTNLPPENDSISSQNKEKEDMYQKNLKAWDEYEAKKAKGENVRKPTNLSRRPYRREFKEPIIQCMCSTSFCLMEGYDTSSSCPIKCLKQKDGDVDQCLVH